ncbi:hypothetical protein X777_11453 [Ooceraea biroi]|uniref:MYND-type domain-containing protein n=1 Tax=Ooceraea biroi TaxID=2015173 RepID=A0A026W1L8_OOCBI|nr:hypothetical protein X777_11453 [Ooceraea biroi]
MGRRKKNSRKTLSVGQKSSEKIASENSKFDKKETTRQEEEYFAVPEATIDAYSRLKLPLVQPMQHCQTISSDSDEEEDTIELNFCPRFVFVSSLCLICMERSEKICESCGMVSYCGDRHRELDWLKHRDLCAVLSKVCTTGEGLSLLPELSADEYRVYRLKLIEIVAHRLARPLELWEREILLYPRICRGCRRFSKMLRCCEACGVELFCEDHDHGHEKWCREFQKLFLHLLPTLKHLQLMFIGPELRLPTVPLDLLATVKICSACKLSGRRVNVSFHPGKFYHDFCRSKQFVKPHLVCLFNPGLYRETGFDGRDTWPETIREFCKARVPVCVTSYTKHEIPREMIRIKSIADVETILEPQRNPFASIKPDRNFVSDDTAPLIYKNYYIAIIKGKS